MMKTSLMDTLIAPWKSAVLYTAVRLEIFTVLADGRMSVPELAGRIRARPGRLNTLLNACAAMGLLTAENSIYANTHFSRVHLVSGRPLYVGDLVKMLNQESRKWGELFSLIKPEEPSGDKPGEEPQAVFTRAMNNMAMLGEADALAREVDLSGRRSMVDAGCGSGMYSVVLVQKYPDLRATLLDTPQTLAATEKIMAGFGEKDRICLKPSDIVKDPFPPNQDVVLLSDVVYAASDAGAILKNARDALKDNGLLVIRGYYLDTEKMEPEFGALFAVNMLVFDSDRKIVDRNTLKKQVQTSGFSITKTAPLTQRSFILLAEKTPA